MSVPFLQRTLIGTDQTKICLLPGAHPQAFAEVVTPPGTCVSFNLLMNFSFLNPDLSSFVYWGYAQVINVLATQI